MSISSGTLGILGVVNNKMGDAGYWLNNGAPPPGKEALYGIKPNTAGTASDQDLAATLAGLVNALSASNPSQGTSADPNAAAATGTVDANTLQALTNVVSALMSQEKKSSGMSLAQQMNLQAAQVRPLEKSVVKSKPGDLTPLGSGSGE